MIQFKNKIKFKDYRNVMLLMTFTRPPIIFAMLLGVFSLFTSLKYIANFSDLSDPRPVIIFIFGLFILTIIPYSVLTKTRAAYYSNNAVKETINFEFTEEQICLRGESFNTNYKWENVYRVEEFKNWILLYTNSFLAHPIFKRQVDDQSLLALKELIKQKKIRNNFV